MYGAKKTPATTLRLGSCLMFDVARLSIPGRESLHLKQRFQAAFPARSSRKRPYSKREACIERSTMSGRTAAVSSSGLAADLESGTGPELRIQLKTAPMQLVPQTVLILGATIGYLWVAVPVQIHMSPT